MTNIVSKMMAVLLVFILVVEMLCFVMVSEQITATRSIVADVTNFIDEVTDTGVADKKSVADLYLACDSHGPLLDVQILRLKKVVNPDPKHLGKTVVTYVGDDNIYEWNQGDSCKVVVKQVGATGMEYFAYSTFGFTLAPVNFTLAGRIR